MDIVHSEGEGCLRAGIDSCHRCGVFTAFSGSRSHVIIFLDVGYKKKKSYTLLRGKKRSNCLRAERA